MRPSRKYDEWERIMGKIEVGMPRAEVEQRLGVPSRVVSTAPGEIIAYREEQIGQSIYSIRVAYTNERVSQCYLGFELCDAKGRGKPQGRSLWSRFFRLFAVSRNK